MSDHEYSYPLAARFLHLGMAGFGLAAYATADFAEGGANATGYLVHAYLGLSLATLVLLRVLRGLAGPGPLRFSGWSPFSRGQWQMAVEDVRSLWRWQVPGRGMHEGLAGLTQAFGLALFAWMGATGTGLFLLVGGPETRLLDLVEEVHELGEALIPLYLTLHVGSVVLHSMAGTPIWQRMWTFRAKRAPHQAVDCG